MIVGHKATLDPPDVQETSFRKAAGVARFRRATFPWMLGVTKNAPQMAVIHWGQAFKNFCNYSASSYSADA